jgi:hypothetical protein
MTSSFYLALTPWLVFVVSGRSAGIGAGYSAAIASAVALTVFANNLRLRRRDPLPPVAAIGFAGLAVVVAAAHDPQWVGRFDRTIAAAFLAACLLASFAREPRTVVWGRQRVTAKRSPTMAFRDQPGRLALRWSLASGLIAVSFTVGALVGGRAGDTVFDWLLPMVLIVLFATRPVAPERAGIDDEVASAMDVLDGFVSHQSCVPRSRTARPQPLRLVPTSPGNGAGAGRRQLP